MTSIKSIVKSYLNDNGIKILCKEITRVEVNYFDMVSADGSIFPHRIIYTVYNKSVVLYNIYLETVDNENNFSLGSAKYHVYLIDRFQ